MGGPRTVVTVFQKYQNSKSSFAQEIADLAGRPECVEQLMQENIIYILKGLLTDVSLSIQQNAVIAVGKLASHSVEIAELLDKEDVLRTLIYVNIERPHRYLKRATLNSLRSIVKHNAALARSVVEMGGLELILGCMEEFDASVKEAAAFVLGYIARQDPSLALAVVGSGCVPLLVMSLQEPEVNVRVVSASALADIAKHSEDTAQSILDAGAVSHLVRATSNLDTRLKRQALYALASLAKHSLYMAETVMEAEVFPLVLEHAGHTDEYIRKAACSLVKEIVKHSPDLAQMVVEAGGLGVLINSVIKNKGENRLPAILAVGFIAGHTPALGLSVIYSKGVDALSLALDEEFNNHVGAAAAWALGIFDTVKRCPPHDNIIEITHAFVDQIPMLPEGMEKFPSALPRRLNDVDGLGRNMSLFLVMKRFAKVRLQSGRLLNSRKEMNFRTRLFIFTQLLDAVAHLERNKIAHRDLKTDNVLVDARESDEYPKIVLTDFGCCLADKSNGLQLAFRSYDTERGGNAALMAPEISTAVPGSWKWISYDKSDAWSVGTMAYEVFGDGNPFYRSSTSEKPLDSRTYQEADLKPLSGEVPVAVQNLVHALLRRNANERISAQEAATVCHLHLWAPSSWLTSGNTPDDDEIMQWLVTLTTKALCHGSEEVQYRMIQNFLRRIKFRDVRSAITWIKNNR